MGREKDIEKKFTEYLDRILAGEEIQADPAMDEELRAALDFARKMATLRTAPSSQYQARLKASLLQKLEAQRREGRGSFWNVFRSHPVWQGAAAALFVIILVSIIWRAGFFQPSITAPTTTPPAATTAAPTTVPAATTPAAKPSPGTLISIDATADKSTYQPGEMVKIELAMKNITTGQLTVKDFPPILSLMAAETGQPVYTFAAGKQTRVLMPNEAARYTYTWPQVDFKGRPVSGSYYVELEDLEYQGRAIKLNLNQPARFEILPKDIPTTTVPDLSSSLSVNITTDKLNYQFGDMVYIQLGMKNISQTQIEIDTILFYIVQKETGQTAYIDRLGQGQVLAPLAPNESITRRLLWRGISNDGKRESGQFYIKLEKTEGYGRVFQINLNEPAFFNYLPHSESDRGPWTLNFYLPLTADNITISLQQIVITDSSITVTAYLWPPPGYAVTLGETGYRSIYNYSANAMYSFDGGWLQDAGKSSVVYMPGGVNYTWIIPITVPSGAGELSFNITSVGTREGSWLFTVQLK